MSTQGGMEPRSTAIAPCSSTRLKGWAARRTRQLVRVSLAFLIVIAVIVAAALLRRATCLIGLPDVGDPFDVAAMVSSQIPDDRNAFAYYRRAINKVRKLPDVPTIVRGELPVSGWATADPKVRAWAESNGDVLELFRAGAEQQDGSANIAATETAFRHDNLFPQRLVELAILEAVRREEQGDFPGAWNWYRTIIRMRSHLMRRGTSLERYVANINCQKLKPRIEAWATNPKNQVFNLRTALDDMTACAPRSEWEASSLKVDYLLAMHELDRPERVLTQGDSDQQRDAIWGELLPPELRQPLRQLTYSTKRFLLREPERSRRVIRLVYANWLAHLEVPEERGRKPTIRVKLRNNGMNPIMFLYTAGPAARPIPPQRLAEWMVTSPDANWLQVQWLWSVVGRSERRQHRDLLMLLAEELYRREHGQPAASEKDLAGISSEVLSDDDTTEVDDLDIPTVGREP